MLAIAHMFKNRLENYWMTRPDIFHFSFIQDLENFLSLYDLSLKFIPCSDLPDLCILQSSTAEAQVILKVVQGNCIIDSFVKGKIEEYIEKIPLSYIEYKAQQNYLNLANADYKDFFAFITHVNIGMGRLDSANMSYVSLTPAKNFIEGDFNNLLVFYTKLLQQSDQLYAQFETKKLDEILSFVFSDYNYGLESLIYDSRLSFEIRSAAIVSIYDLYAKLLIHDPVEYHRYMLWDGLAFKYTMNSFTYYFDELDKVPLQNVMFTTLLQILNLDSKDCQFAALHGLNHLKHPDNELAIRNFLAKHDDLSIEDIEFAEACIKGNMM